MGPSNAERTARQALKQCQPSRLLTCGWAGGLNPQLSLGQVVYEADDDFPGSAAFSAAGGRPGRFLGLSHVLVTSAEKQASWQASRADAVEMESATIRAVCRENKVPAATVRVISDTAQEDLPLDFNRYFTPDLRTNWVKLIRELVLAPWVLPRLWRFHRQTQAAACRLANVLRAYVENSPS